MENNNDTPQKNNLNPLLIVAVLIVLAGAGLILIKSMRPANNTISNAESPTETFSPVQSANPSVQGTEGSTDNENIQTINVEAGSFYFKPNLITVKKGQKVKIILTSRDMMHDFFLDEFDVKSPITKEGETNTVEFTPDKTGQFEFYCSVGQHRKMGQVGKLIVQ